MIVKCPVPKCTANMSSAIRRKAVESVNDVKKSVQEFLNFCNQNRF